MQSRNTFLTPSQCRCEFPSTVCPLYFRIIFRGGTLVTLQPSRKHKCRYGRALERSRHLHLDHALQEGERRGRSQLKPEGVQGAHLGGRSELMNERARRVRSCKYSLFELVIEHQCVLITCSPQQTNKRIINATEAFWTSYFRSAVNPPSEKTIS